MTRLRPITHWLRGLKLLRYPELVVWLGQEQSRLAILRQIVTSRKDFRISPSVQLLGWLPDLLILEQSGSIGHGTVLAFGDEWNGRSPISIGAGSCVGEYNNIRSGAGHVQIGRQCMISQFVSIIGSGHGLDRGTPIMEQSPPQERRGVTIGNDVWIGAGATILPGVTIMDGVVIGAGAVVSRSVEEGMIVAGIPTKVIGQRR